MNGPSVVTAIFMEIKAISLSATPGGLAAGINYFFAVMPDEAVRAEIVDIAGRFRKSHRVNGISVAPDNLHLELCPMGRIERLSQSPEQALLAAAATVQARGFRITLDSAMRFTGRDGQFPFVLCADGGSMQAALELRKAIAAAQLKLGLRVSAVSSFAPHVVLQHAHLIDAIEESITPIHWPVADFVLIRTFFGHSRQEVVGRWPLARAVEEPAIDLLCEMSDLLDLPESPDEG